MLLLGLAFHLSYIVYVLSFAKTHTHARTHLWHTRTNNTNIGPPCLKSGLFGIVELEPLTSGFPTDTYVSVAGLG